MAFLSALFVSFRAALEKRSLREMDEFVVALGLRFFAFLFLFPLVLLLGVDIPFENNTFFLALLAGSCLNSISTVLVMKALKEGDLSMVGPMTTFTPLFVLFTSPFIVGEFPPLQGVLGVLCIVLGAYIINIKELRNGYKAPFVSLFENKGVLFMLGAAFVWSIASNVDKIGVEASHPFLWALGINAFVTLLLSIAVLVRGEMDHEREEFSERDILPLSLIGFVAMLVSVFQLYALSMILVVYVISLKRMSVIFEVLIGHFGFKEKSFKERLGGAFIMLLGAVLIIFS